MDYRILLVALYIRSSHSVTSSLLSQVTYDEHSLRVHGERIYVFSGEFHPYRLPVPDLWLDVFQKIKALGFNAVSYYVHWALLEGEQGKYLAEGIFAQDPFYEAAQMTGIYLIARPGPVSDTFCLLPLFLLTSHSTLMLRAAEAGFRDGSNASKRSSELEIPSTLLQLRITWRTLVRALLKHR